MVKYKQSFQLTLCGQTQEIDERATTVGNEGEAELKEPESCIRYSTEHCDRQLDSPSE